MTSVCTRLMVLLGMAGLMMTAIAQTSADWAERMPTIRELLKVPPFHGAGMDPNSPSVRRSGALKQSGLPVALVDVGSGYGAMNDGLAVFAILRGQVITPAFQRSNGRVERGGTVLSEGASVMHSEWVEIDERDDAIVTRTAFMSRDGSRVAKCETDAFRWDRRREIFTAAPSLSRRLHKAGCKVRELTAVHEP